MLVDCHGMFPQFKAIVLTWWRKLELYGVEMNVTISKKDKVVLGEGILLMSEIKVDYRTVWLKID